MIPPGWLAVLSSAGSGMGELLRRLGVIVIEDALLHPALPLVTWLMAAQVRSGAAGVGVR